MNNKKDPLPPFGDNYVNLLYAYSENSGKLLNIEDSYSGGQYLCPLCGKHVFPRKGDHNRHSYAHKKGFVCQPDNVKKEKFLIELALELFEEYQRINTPPRSFRIKKNGKFVLTSKEEFEKIQINKIIETDIQRCEDGFIGLVKAKTWKNFSLAVIFTYNRNLPERIKYKLLKEGYCVLEVDLSSIQINLDLETNLKEIILKSIDFKRWITTIPLTESLNYLKKVSRKNAFQAINNVECNNKKLCSSCKYYCEFSENECYCIKNYSEDPYGQYELTEIPNYIREIDSYIELTKKNIKKSKQQKEAWLILKKCLKYLNENAPTKGRSSALLEVGQSDISLNNESGIFDIKWGISHETIIILVTPNSDNKRKYTYLFKIQKFQNYLDSETNHIIRVFKTHLNEDLKTDNIFGEIKDLQNDNSLWKEITIRDKVKILEDYCNKLNEILKNCITIKIVEVNNFLEEASKFITENGSFYEEDKVNILEPSRFYYVDFYEDENIGELDFEIPDIEKEFGYYLYNALWENPLDKVNPIKFSKSKNSIFENNKENKYEDSSSKEFYDRWKFFKDRCDFTKLVNIEDNKIISALSPENLQLSKLGKILFKADIPLKSIWEEIKDLDLISLDLFRDILLGEKNFSETTSTKFVNFLMNKFDLEPDKVIELIQS